MSNTKRSVLHLNKLATIEKEMIDTQEGESGNSPIIEAEAKIVPVGFESEKDVDDFVLRRNAWGMWRIANKGGKGVVPKCMRGKYTERAAQGIIAKYVEDHKVKIEDK